MMLTKTAIAHLGNVRSIISVIAIKNLSGSSNHDAKGSTGRSEPSQRSGTLFPEGGQSTAERGSQATN